MKNLKINTFIYILLGFSVATWFALALIYSLDLTNFWNLIKLIPTVATLDLIIWMFFVRWGWRWRIFRGWLVPFPDLTGTWQGNTKTNWKDGRTDKNSSQIPTILSIKQTFGNISCVLRTAEMISNSNIEGFKIDSHKQIRQLVYSYTSKPKPSVRARSASHDGTAVFDIIGTPVSKLEGRYWTDRETTGEISLSYRGKKILDELPENFSPHPTPK